MKYWPVKITHENWNWMKKCLWIRHLQFFRKPILLHDLEFFLTWSQNSCSRPSVEFVILKNQNSTSIKIRKKMEEFGEKMKTHVSKISSGSRASVMSSGKMKSHNRFQRCKNKNLKMGFFMTDSLDREISGSIFRFEIGWEETEIL